MITQPRFCLLPAVDSRTMGLVRYTPMTANQVNLLNCFLFQQLQFCLEAQSDAQITDEITASSALFDNAGTRRQWGGCCPVQQTMCNYTVVPVGLLGRPVDGWLSSVNEDWVKLKLGSTSFSVAVSVHPGQWYVFCTPSFAVFPHAVINWIQIWQTWRPELRWDKFRNFFMWQRQW